MNLKKIISEELMAFLPVYMPSKGDCTKLYTKQGGVYEVPKNIKTVLNQLCKCYFIDLKEVKKYYGNMLYTNTAIPIPLTEEDVLVYIKVRKPICKNDCASGFVNIRYIERVIQEEDNIFVELANKEKIKCLYSYKVINKHIKNGHIVKELYKENHKSMAINEKDYSNEYNKPITIGDIVFLAEKIISYW